MKRALLIFLIIFVVMQFIRPNKENSAVDKVCTESIFPTKSSVYPLSFRKIPTYMLNTPAENESKKLAVK